MWELMIIGFIELTVSELIEARMKIKLESGDETERFFLIISLKNLQYNNLNKTYTREFGTERHLKYQECSF